MSEAEKPLVSVCMITYNHERYIAEAIDGVLMQEIDFPFELVIGEDRSTDRTREIALSFQAKFPDKIRVLERHTNLGMSVNFADTIRECRGKFIAFCEGDDYWIDGHKLQRQAAFLSTNREYSGICSGVMLRNGNSDELHPQLLHKALKPEEDITVERMLDNFTLHTATLMCRKECVDLSIYSEKVLTTDISVFLQCLRTGPIRFINSPDTVYRIHEGGVTYSREYFRFYKMVLDFLDTFDELTENEYREHTDRKRRRLRFYSNINKSEISALRKGIDILRYSVKHRGEIDLTEFKNILGLAFPRMVSEVQNLKRSTRSGSTSASS